MGLQAAAGTIDITPEVTPTAKPRLYGWGPHYADGIDDKIYARALLLAHGGVKALIVSLDIAWASETETCVPSGPPPDTDAVKDACNQAPATLPPGTRKTWAEAAGITDTGIVKKGDLITVNATHTHTAPSLFREEGAKNPPVEAIQKEIQKLPGSLANVVVRVGTRECPLAVYRAVQGTTPAKHYPVDRTLTVMEFLSGARPVARLVNFGVHPILSRNVTKIGPDFVGAAMQTLDSRRGGVSLFVQGFSGELGPSFNGYYAGQTMGLEQVRWMGTLFADEVEAALKDAPTIDVESLDVAYKPVTKMPLRTRRCIRGVDPVRLHGIRFGKSAILVSVSAELFSDYGPMLKKYLFPNYRYVLTSGVANGYCGYLPTAAAFGRQTEIPEYEVDVSPFLPEMEKTLLDSVRKLFG